MDEEELDRMARQVHELCSSRRLSDILVDLKKTKNVELTVNRIFDGGVSVPVAMPFDLFTEKQMTKSSWKEPLATPH